MRKPSGDRALLAYCEAEAEALIRANRDIVEGLTDGLVDKGTLVGEEVDAIIAACVARRALTAEQERRKRWQGIMANASNFEVEQHRA